MTTKPVCPVHQKRLIKKVAQRGPLAGGVFYGCPLWQSPTFCSFKLEEVEYRTLQAHGATEFVDNQMSFDWGQSHGKP